MLGGAVLLLFLVFAVGEGFGREPLSATETIMFVCLGTMSLGIIVAYWRELVGCLLVIGGYAGFTICDRDFNLDNPFVLFPVVVILYAFGWILSRGKA
jgi:hypothetical protein